MASLTDELAAERQARQEDRQATHADIAAVRAEERARSDQRMHTYSSVQHSLEERLKDCQEQLAAAQAQLSEPRPPSVGTARAGGAARQGGARDGADVAA